MPSHTQHYPGMYKLNHSIPMNQLLIGQVWIHFRPGALNRWKSMKNWERIGKLLAFNSAFLSVRTNLRERISRFESLYSNE
jgi:hypothetical protein